MTVNGGRWWCIDPSGKAGTCVISLMVLGSRAWLDPNGYQGQGGDHLCDVVNGNGETSATSVTLDASGTKPFGGRESEYRRWTQMCPGYTVHDEQYTVATSQAWVLFSDKTTDTYSGDTVSEVMATIASTSVLPKQNMALRLADEGIVRSLTTDATGITTIVIDRIDLCPDDRRIVVNTDTKTYTYVIPTDASWTLRGQVVVGARAVIGTNGSKVTSVSTYTP